MQAIAIIPARGGSKGIPHKNITLLGGKPLISYAIQAAQNARFISKVYVSTDCPQIASVSADYNAQPILRPAELSGDTASSESALIHALEYLGNAAPEHIAFLQCTSPFLKSNHIDQVLLKLQDSNLDSCFAAKPFEHFLWQPSENGQATGINHDASQPRIRRQDLPEQALELGSVYAFKKVPFLIEKTRFCGKIGYALIPDANSLEIDTLQDLHLAEAYLQAMQYPV